MLSCMAEFKAEPPQPPKLPLLLAWQENRSFEQQPTTAPAVRKPKGVKLRKSVLPRRAGPKAKGGGETKEFDALQPLPAVEDPTPEKAAEDSASERLPPTLDKDGLPRQVQEEIKPQMREIGCLTRDFMITTGHEAELKYLSDQAASRL